MKTKFKRIVSILLCCCFLVNAPCYRRDVQAFIDPVTASYVASFLISVLLTAAGIYTKQYLDSEEGQKFCQDCANWISEKHSEFNDMVNSICTDPNDVLLGNYPQAAWQFLVPATHYETITGWILEYLKQTDPQLFPDYDPVFTAGMGTFDNIQIAYYTFQQDMALSMFGYEFNQDDKSLTSYSLPDAISDDYKYFRFYYRYYPYGELEKYENLLYFGCLCWNDDGSYKIFANLIRQHANSGTTSDGSIGHTLSSSAKTGTDMVADDVLNLKLNFGLNKSYQTLNDLNEVAYYINTTVTGDESDVPVVSPTPESIFELASDNAITNPNYIDNVINNYSTVISGANDDEPVIALNYPVYGDTHNIIGDLLNGLRATDVLNGSSATGVQTGVNENVSTVNGAVAISNIGDIANAVSSAINYGDGNLNGNKFEMNKDLTTVFPFCIPFDLIRVYKVFNADPVAPVFSFDFTTLPVFSDVPSEYHDNLVFTLDMADYDDFVQIEKVFVFLSFVLFLILKTRDLVRG